MRNPRIELWRDTQVLRVPVVGHLVHNMQLTLWTLTLIRFAESGCSHVGCFGRSLPASSANRLLGIATIRVRTLISHGISLADALAKVSPPSSQFRLFPVLLIQLVAVG
jgi:type II secretory pathway component PulF